MVFNALQVLAVSPQHHVRQGHRIRNPGSPDTVGQDRTAGVENQRYPNSSRVVNETFVAAVGEMPVTSKRKPAGGHFNIRVSMLDAGYFDSFHTGKLGSRFFGYVHASFVVDIILVLMFLVVVCSCMYEVFSQSKSNGDGGHTQNLHHQPAHITPMFESYAPASHNYSATDACTTSHVPSAVSPDSKQYAPHSYDAEGLGPDLRHVFSASCAPVQENTACGYRADPTDHGRRRSLTPSGRLAVMDYGSEVKHASNSSTDWTRGVQP